MVQVTVWSSLTSFKTDKGDRAMKMFSKYRKILFLCCAFLFFIIALSGCNNGEYKHMESLPLEYPAEQECTDGESIRKQINEEQFLEIFEEMTGVHFNELWPDWLVKNQSHNETSFSNDYALSDPQLPSVQLDEATLRLVNENFGEILINHLVHFDFVGEGEYSIVIFGSYQEFTEETYDVSKNAAVFALIGGEAHQIRAGGGEVIPTAVFPFTFWDGEGSDFDSKRALLFVDRDLVGNDWAYLVVFDGGNLQIYWLQPVVG